VRRIVQAVHPEQILLFGSQAWGQPTADSDIDLLVILGASDQPGYRRTREVYRSLRGLRSRERPSARPQWSGKHWITGVSSIYFPLETDPGDADALLQRSQVKASSFWNTADRDETDR
jgi:hypothetical protein